MSSSTSIIIDEEDFQKKFVEDFLPCFGLLRNSELTIPPWVEPNFWDNCRCVDFARLFLVELFDFIIKIAKKMIGTKSNVAPPEIENALLGILHLLITFKIPLEKTSWNEYYQKLIVLPYPILSYFLIHISRYCVTQDNNMKIILDCITSKYDSPDLKQSAPLFNFVGLIRTLNSDPNAEKSLFAGFKSRLESINNMNETIVLLHIIEVIITIFPSLSKDSLLELSEKISSAFVLPLPASSKAYEIQKNIRKTLQHPGFTYYRMLRTLGSMNEATEAVVPFCYDAKVVCLPSLLHTRQSPYSALHKAFINFGNYYLVTKFNDKSRSPKEVLQLLENLDFDEGSDESLIEKCNITKNPEPVEEFDVNLLQPVPIQIAQKKYSAVPFNLQQTDTFVDGTECFTSVIPMRFVSEIFTPIVNWAKKRESDEIFDYKIMSSGDAMFMSHILYGLIKATFKFKQELSKMVFSVYLIQVDDNDYAPLPEYIAANDEIYARFIHKNFAICSRLSPTLNPISQVGFPIINFEKHLPPNVWFSNPAPSAMMQMAMQQYIFFAHNMLTCYVWKAVIQFEEKSITVPFITSLHIGHQFARGAFSDPDMEKKIRTKKVQISYDSVPVYNHEITSIVLWNCDAHLNIRPSDPSLIMEVINDTSNADIDNYREQLGGQITRTPVKQFYISGIEKNPCTFTVFIDGSVFQKVRTVTVFTMEDISEGSHMTINIPTFLPIE